MPSPLVSTFPLVAKKGATLFYFAPQEVQTDTDFINPYIMNGSFSLELHMKYLHALETERKLLGGHRLWDLFSNLTNESKDAIRTNFSAITKASALHKNISRIFNKELRLPFTWSLELLLKRADLAFERWRYIYEGEDTTWFAGYSEMQQAIWQRADQLEKEKLGALVPSNAL
jgi:hypothetical protein